MDFKQNVDPGCQIMVFADMFFVKRYRNSFCQFGVDMFFVACRYTFCPTKSISATFKNQFVKVKKTIRHPTKNITARLQKSFRHPTKIISTRYKKYIDTAFSKTISIRIYKNNIGNHQNLYRQPSKTISTTIKKYIDIFQKVIR